MPIRFSRTIWTIRTITPAIARTVALTAALGAILGLFMPIAQAQPYPSRPIKLIFDFHQDHGSVGHCDRALRKAQASGDFARGRGHVTVDQFGMARFSPFWRRTT